MGHTRYKSRFPPLMDLCTDCLAASPRERDHFLRLDNQVEEMVFHEYFECNPSFHSLRMRWCTNLVRLGNLCKVQPIPGIRFTCSVCPGFDICEGRWNHRLCPCGNRGPDLLAACFDKSPLWNDQIHSQIHAFIPREIPQLAGGLPIHRLRCSGCHTFPIIGYCFSCTQCKNINLCASHKSSIILDSHPSRRSKMLVSEKGTSFPSLGTQNANLYRGKCQPRRNLLAMVCASVPPLKQLLTLHFSVGCSMNPIQGARFQCNSCFHLNLCHECYWDNKTIDDSYVAHKHSHSYTCITDGLAVPFPPASSPSGKKHAAANILLESFVKHS